VRCEVFAPGRVNLIGGHSDYTGGLVLPMAIDLGTTIVGRRGGDVVRLRSAAEPEPAVVPLDVDDPAVIEPAWARYVAGVVVATGQRVGFDGEVTSDLPIGNGLSSSAALEVAVALALGADDGDRVALAQVLRDAEQAASGVPCGVQDQLASLCGVDGHALLVDASTLRIDPVPIPEGVEVVVLDSGQQRRLADLPYAARRDETVAAAALLGGFGAPQHASDADVAAIDDPVLRRRARHIVGESRRVRDCAAALASGDVVAAGRLMTESHASLRDHQEVSTAVLDGLVDRLVATPGVHGARVTGGGFGGCVVALCEREALPAAGWHVRPSAGATVELLA
jgi:galactokinase